VALVLMVLVGAVAWINARSTQRVDALITSVNEISVPAYGDLARSNLRAVEEGLFVRRLIIARLLTAEDHNVLSDLEHGADEKAAQAEAELADARRLIGREIADSRGLQDASQLSRLDARMEFLQTRHKEYEMARAAVDTAVAAGDTVAWKEKVQELDQVRDLFNDELELTRRDMMKLLADFGHMVQETQASATRYGLVLL